MAVNCSLSFRYSTYPNNHIGTVCHLNASSRTPHLHQHLHWQDLNNLGLPTAIWSTSIHLKVRGQGFISTARVTWRCTKSNMNKRRTFDRLCWIPSFLAYENRFNMTTMPCDEFAPYTLPLPFRHWQDHHQVGVILKYTICRPNKLSMIFMSNSIWPDLAWTGTTSTNGKMFTYHWDDKSRYWNETWEAEMDSLPGTSWLPAEIVDSVSERSLWRGRSWHCVRNFLYLEVTAFVNGIWWANNGNVPTLIQLESKLIRILGNLDCVPTLTPLP